MNSDTETSAVAASGAIDFPALAEQIKQWGCELGFSGIGITLPDTAEATPRFQRWLALGRHGGMDYMAKHADLRASPEFAGIAGQFLQSQDFCVASSLPKALTITDVDVVGSNLVIAINGDGTALSGPGLSELGVCKAK